MGRLQSCAMPSIASFPFPINLFSSDSSVVSNPCSQNLSYLRLPVQLLKLTILKLDGSSFDVMVSRSASVRDLKMAVEEVFCQSRMDMTIIESISWTHVWRQFCLSYGGIKLIEDKALLKKFGIKDNDQLEFVRYISISYAPIKQWQSVTKTNVGRRRRSWSGAEPFDFQFDEPVAQSERETICVRKRSPWQFKLSLYLKGFLCYSNPIYMTREM